MPKTGRRQAGRVQADRPRLIHDGTVDVVAGGASVGEAAKSEVGDLFLQV